MQDEKRQISPTKWLNIFLGKTDEALEREVLKRLLNWKSATWLAQLIERQSALRELEGSSPDQTNTQGLKITEENVLPL